MREQCQKQSCSACRRINSVWKKPEGEKGERLQLGINTFSSDLFSLKKKTHQPRCFTLGEGTEWLWLKANTELSWSYCLEKSLKNPLYKSKNVLSFCMMLSLRSKNFLSILSSLCLRGHSTRTTSFHMTMVLIMHVSPTGHGSRHTKTVWSHPRR